MEVPGGPQNKLLVCLYEAMGTCMLMLGINFTTAVGYWKIISIGMTLMSAIVCFGHVGGAHFNPAVTTGVLINKGINGQNIVFYIMIVTSQIIGAMLAFGVVSIAATKSKDGMYNTVEDGINILCPPTGKTDCVPSAPW